MAALKLTRIKDVADAMYSLQLQHKTEGIWEELQFFFLSYNIISGMITFFAEAFDGGWAWLDSMHSTDHFDANTTRF